MKLYHWTILTNGKRFDYLCMAESEAAARKAIIKNIRTPGGAEAKTLLHDEIVADREPSFVAEENYPIVIAP